MISMTKDEMHEAIDALLALLQEFAELTLREGEENDSKCPLNLNNIRLFSNSTNE